jgi:hypothetical protein
VSYKTGIFPESWKVASVQPVGKKGCKSDPKNYRLISIISVIAKVFEKHVNRSTEETWLI